MSVSLFIRRALFLVVLVPCFALMALVGALVVYPLGVIVAFIGGSGWWSFRDAGEMAFWPLEEMIHGFPS